ncbi:MAG: hypothetical protein ABFS86_20440 [Planctomycetota bacterium]
MKKPVRSIDDEVKSAAAPVEGVTFIEPDALAPLFDRVRVRHLEDDECVRLSALFRCPE